MKAAEYNRFLSAIKVANNLADKHALAQIQKKLITEYPSGDKDVDYLIRQFRYHVD